MAQFTAKMQHSPETIEKLAEARQRTFQFGKRIAHSLIAILLIVYGIYGSKQMYTPYIALIIGCTMITGLNAGIKRQAKAVIRQMGNNFPKSDYTFNENGFSFYHKGEIIPYSKLCRLIEDKKYLYLYISTQSAYMVDKSTVSGGTYTALKDFISAKSGLVWSRPNSIFNFSFTGLTDKFKNSKREYQGPRLK